MVKVYKVKSPNTLAKKGNNMNKIWIRQMLSPSSKD